MVQSKAKRFMLDDRNEPTYTNRMNQKRQSYGGLCIYKQFVMNGVDVVSNPTTIISKPQHTYIDIKWKTNQNPLTRT